MIRVTLRHLVPAVAVAGAAGAAAQAAPPATPAPIVADVATRRVPPAADSVSRASGRAGRGRRRG